MLKRRTVLAGLGAVALPGLLAGCGGSADDETRVRLFNASKAYGSLDLYVEGDLERAGIAYGALSDYFSPDDGGGTYTLALTRSGSGTYVYRADSALSDRKPYTLVAYGAVGSLTALLLLEDEDEDDVDSGDARIRLVNVATDAGTLDVYLTGQDESLADAIPLASDLTVSGSASPTWLDVLRGTYRLRVTGADDKDDVRLDIGGVVLADGQIASVVLAGAAGGVLVDAFVLTQEGSLTTYANPAARVRVVAGVTGNGVVGAAIGGATLGAGFAAPTVGDYLLVTAGTVTPAVTVDGAAVAASAVTLGAGSDYTLLVYGEAAAAQIALLADDNRLPTNAAQARMRLVHGVAGLNTTLSLTLNFGSVASGVAYGTASAYDDEAPGTELTLDVTAPGFGTLFERTDLTIQANSVYTVFMLGSSTAPVGQLLLERQGSSTASTPVPAASAASS